MEDKTQEHNLERVASSFDLCYRYLGGDIGLMSCSAGSAMAACDLIEQHGGKPANFVDLHGAVIHEQIHEISLILE